jgi:hypothetical protein
VSESSIALLAHGKRLRWNRILFHPISLQPAKPTTRSSSPQVRGPPAAATARRGPRERTTSPSPPRVTKQRRLVSFSRAKNHTPAKSETAFFFTTTRDCELINAGNSSALFPSRLWIVLHGLPCSPKKRYLKQGLESNLQITRSLVDR